MGDVPFRNVSSMCDFLEEIARHKTFSAHFLEEIGRHKTISAHFLRKSLATKLFRLISSGNRPPQNYFGSFPQEIGCHKTISAHFLRKSAATNFFGSFPQEIGRTLTHSFPQEIAGWASTHFLRKSLDDLHRTGRYSYILTSNSRFRRCTWKGAFLTRSPCSSSPNRLKNTVLVRFFLHLAIRSRSDRFQS